MSPSSHSSTRKKASRQRDLQRILQALETAAVHLRSLPPRILRQKSSRPGDILTHADRDADRLLRKMLLRKGEGWLSEESKDSRVRLSKSRVWEVDPLDGTREYSAGIPEWCVSIALVEDGEAVAGGILNPVTEELFLGSRETGLRCEGITTRARRTSRRGDVVVLASRSEVARGEWRCFSSAPFTALPVGSVAYKLALVACGCADATWTFVPKNEWDVAAGVALVSAAGGGASTLGGIPPTFNRLDPRLDGLVAYSRRGRTALRRILMKTNTRWGKAASILRRCL